MKLNFEQDRNSRLFMMGLGGLIIIVALTAGITGISASSSLSAGKILLMGVGAFFIVVGIAGRDFPKFYQTGAILLLNTLVLFILIEFLFVGLSRVGIINDKPEVVTLFPTSYYEELDYYKNADWGLGYWAERATSRIRYQPYVVWRQGSYNGTYINVNESGQRIVGDGTCEPDSLQVFAFGGSTMYGEGAPDWGTIPAYLQTDLEATLDTPVCVTNFGQVGWVSNQSVIELTLQLKGGNIPDMVIFYDGINDPLSAYQTGFAGSHFKLISVGENVEEENGLVTWFKDKLTSVRYVIQTYERLEEDEVVTYKTLGINEDELADGVISTYLENYDYVHVLGEEFGFTSYFFWQPHIFLGDKSYTSDEEEALRRGLEEYPDADTWFAAVDAKFAPIASDYEDLYYIVDVFDDVTDMLYVDIGHLNPEGNQIIASKMVETITADSE